MVSSNALYSNGCNSFLRLPVFSFCLLIDLTARLLADDPNVAERLRQILAQSTQCEKASMVYFEAVERTENFLGTNEFRENRYLGRRIARDGSQFRVDFVQISSDGRSISTRAAHSLYLSDKEFLCANGFLGTQLVRKVPEGQPSFTAMPFLSPWQAIFYGDVTLRDRSKREFQEAVLANFVPLESDATKKLSGPVKYMVTQEVKSKINEFIFDQDDPFKLTRFITHKTFSDPIPFESFSELGIPKNKDWFPMHDTSISWIDVPGIGRQPHVIHSKSKSAVSGYPTEKTEMEISFFGYEFERSKIPFQLLDKENFTTARINRDFQVSDVELLLEKDKRQSP